MTLAIKVPEVDFGILPKLPALYEAGRGLSERKRTLADLNMEDPDSLERTVRGLIQTGNLENIQLATRLATEARQREALGEQRRASEVVGRLLSGDGGDTSVPRGIRNKNPLNIEAGDFTRGMPGYEGTDGRFAKFTTVEQGLDAADRLLASYGSQGAKTLKDVIYKWAPPGENDSQAYTNRVAMKVGINPNAPIDLSNRQLRGAILSAMADVESPGWLNAGRTQVAQAAPQADPQLQSIIKRGRDAGIALGILGQGLDKGKQEALKSIQDAGLKAEQELRASGLRRGEAEEQSVLRRGEAEEKDVREELIKFSAPYYEDSRKARSAQGTLNTLGRLADEGIVSGPGVGPAFKNIGGMLAGLASVGKAFGFDVPDISKVTDPVKRQEMFHGLANNLVLATAGSLGTNVSNSDRTFYVDMYPGLTNSEAGNKGLILFYKGLNQRKMDMAKWVEEYRALPGKKTAGGLEQYISEKAAKTNIFQNEDGSLTELGKEIKAQKEKASGAAPAQRTKITPEMEGQTVFGPDGKPAGTIRGGRFVPAQTLGPGQM